jgi:hypothetical protein
MRERERKEREREMPCVRFFFFILALNYICGILFMTHMTRRKRIDFLKREAF